MFYREAKPSSEIEHLVLSFWEFVVPDDAPSPIGHEVFPDGCVSFIYNRNRKSGVSLLLVNGLHLESATKMVDSGDVYWGMRISPAATSAFLPGDHSSMSETRMYDAAKFPFFPFGLLDILDQAESFEDAVSVFNDVVNAIDPPFSSDIKVAEAVRIIDECCGAIRIDELAKRINLGMRQLQRRFKLSSGLSPKQFARIRRIRAMAVILVENKKRSWAQRAAEIGFADQSHLIHEFVSLTKRSPRSFAKKVVGIEHGNLVK